MPLPCQAAKRCIVLAPHRAARHSSAGALSLRATNPTQSTLPHAAAQHSTAQHSKQMHARPPLSQPCPHSLDSRRHWSQLSALSALLYCQKRPAGSMTRGLTSAEKGEGGGAETRGHAVPAFLLLLSHPLSKRNTDVPAATAPLSLSTLSPTRRTPAKQANRWELRVDSRIRN
jgi:hypothetical protein